MTRWDVINGHLSKFKESTRFLEIGTKSGPGAGRVHSSEAYGMDPAPVPGTTWNYNHFWKQTSDNFFRFFEEYPLPTFHVVLIDGLHQANQALRDVENSLKNLHPEGLIVVHDCNPQSEAAQMVPRPAGKNRWNGDVWKAIVALRRTRPDLGVYTIDTDEGLGIVHAPVRKVEDVIVPPSFTELTWAGLVENRRGWLGLTQVDEVVCL